MLTQKWIQCSERLPADRWGGKIRVLYPNRRVVEKDCLVFSKGEFSYQDGPRAPHMIWENGGKGRVIAWLGIVEVD
jgi:hypothetical protein